MNFRAFVRSAADDQHGEPYIEHGPTEAGFEPSACSYCGSEEFEPQQDDNGRVQRATCAACGGTMVSHGGQWMPDLIGSPHNHPKENSDPRSGGVGGIGNTSPDVPQKMREEDLSSRTAMPSRNHPQPPAGLHFTQTDEGEDPMGWQGHTLHAHLPGRDEPVGHIQFGTMERDRGPHSLTVQDMRTYKTTDQRQGIGSALQDELRRRHPDHMIDHGTRTNQGNGWWKQYDDPGDPKLDLDHPDNVHKWVHHTSTADWCRHRHAGRCMLPAQAPAGGVALYIPQDRGACPWTTPQTQQINCPVSEPGPMAGMSRSAAMNLPEDAEFHFHPSYAPTVNHQLEMHSGGEAVGKVDWFPSDGHVNAVETHHRYQRRGIGSALLSKAHELSEQHGLPYSNESAFYTPAGAGLLKNHEQRGLADVSHIPTHHHEPPGSEGGDIRQHMIEDHSLKASADNIHAMDEAGVHSWHDKIRKFNPCGWKSASLFVTSVWVEPEWRFHVLAAWRDVRWKAVDIRRGGGVSIVSALSDTITGHVQGDTGVYETQINYVPGSKKIGFWQCGCAWASYAWGRSPAYRRFEGRMCSHALALTYEAQSRGMFGRQVEEDTTRPGWMRDKVRVRHDRETRDHDVRSASRQDPLDLDGIYPSDHGLDLARSPIHAFAVEAFAARQDPADVLRVFLAAGIDHGDARELALACIDDRVSADVQVTAQLQDLGQLGDHLQFEGAEEKPAEPTHAGVALKAADTGRVLMIQRSHQDETDPAAGTWEFPGGGREEGDPTSLHSGIREFEEEVGHEFPTGGHVSHVWQSPNGVYQGHVVVVPHEKVLDLSAGRRTVNPDDPDGDDHEQSAWWHPDDARKNPALRPECKTSPWDKIKAASLVRTADYAAADGLEDVGMDWRPKNPPKAPERGQDVNPGSTGFATGQDPPEWESASQNPSTMSMTMWSSRQDSFIDLLWANYDQPHNWPPLTGGEWPSTQELAARFAELHDEPGPALPSTDGAEDVVEDPGERYRAQMSPQIDGGDDLTPSDGRTAAVATFQASKAFQALQGTERTTSVDIADAARQHLAGQGIQRTALKAFTPQEQHELISEGAGQQARNFKDLQIEGTHYEALSEALAKEQSLAGAEDLFD